MTVAWGVASVRHFSVGAFGADRDGADIAAGTVVRQRKAGIWNIQSLRLIRLVISWGVENA